MSRFLILQLRPETEASDNEYEAILEKSGLDAAQTQRIRLDQDGLPKALDPRDYAGVIVGGGPGCVSDPPEQKSKLDAQMEAACLSLMPVITGHDVPFMGCCYGIGILAHHLGAEVSKERFGEPVSAVTGMLTEDGKEDALLAGLPAQFEILVGHKEAVQALPKGAVHLMASAQCPYQMIRYRENVYATQFHPEADAAVFETRVHVYKNYGYFKPEEAQTLIDMFNAADVRWPEKILERFVQRYR
ncbi:MAG: glutamine amidotransferase [Paracoccaceae bacterium]|nr:glutamine amidotransferase [Paracoccaceae bacterium]